MAYSDVLSLKRIEPAILRVLLAIEDQAVKLAPVDMGQLRNSISVATEIREAKFNENEYGWTAPDSAKITPPPLADGNTGLVGTGLEYAAAVEFGRPDMVNYPTQPFLRPAARIVGAKVRGIYYPEMKKQIAEWAKEERYRNRNNANRPWLANM